MAGQSELSDANHLQSIREYRSNRQKKWYDANDTKLGGLVENLKSSDRRSTLYAKKTDSWMTLKGTTVTSTVLAATDFVIFCAHVMMLPPLTSKN